MLVVVALGGNALLRRGEPLTAENQRDNAKIAAAAIAGVISAGHKVVVTHGNGPQVGLLALQNNAYKPDEAFPLDVLGAETEGMIGYLIERELESVLPAAQRVAVLLTQIEVNPQDQAFKSPGKPIGPIYSKSEADIVAARHNWTMAADGSHFRRVVASPMPQHIPDIDVIRLLLEHNVTVICAGGGGIPVVRQDDGSLVGVEAVIDKDYASALLATQLGADAFLMLTDVAGIYRDWQTPDQALISRTSPPELRQVELATGSIKPKAEAACCYVEVTGGKAGIGLLSDALQILEEQAGTIVTARIL